LNLTLYVIGDEREEFDPSENIFKNSIYQELDFVGLRPSLEVWLQDPKIHTGLGLELLRALVSQWFDCGMMLQVTFLFRFLDRSQAPASDYYLAQLEPFAQARAAEYCEGHLCWRS